MNQKYQALWADGLKQRQLTYSKDDCCWSELKDVTHLDIQDGGQCSVVVPAI